MMLEGIAWRFRTGSPWRTCQPISDHGRRCGSGIIWSLDGTYEAMLTQVAAMFGCDAGMVDGLEKLGGFDEVQAHQHCAGARSDTLAKGGPIELQEICR
jgi:putative transposase